MPTIETSVLTALDGDTAAAMTQLLPQVSSSAAPLTADRIAKVISNGSTHVVLGRMDGTVVGMALLCVCTTLKGQFGFVEEVAVDTAARGHHVGVHLLVELLEHAKELELDFVELTSRPAREAANGLYASLGFERRATNVYRHQLADMPSRR